MHTKNSVQLLFWVQPEGCSRCYGMLVLSPPVYERVGLAFLILFKRHFLRIFAFLALIPTENVDQVIKNKSLSSPSPWKFWTVEQWLAESSWSLGCWKLLFFRYPQSKGPKKCWLIWREDLKCWEIGWFIQVLGEVPAGALWSSLIQNWVMIYLKGSCPSLCTCPCP